MYKYLFLILFSMGVHSTSPIEQSDSDPSLRLDTTNLSAPLSNNQTLTPEKKAKKEADKIEKNEKRKEKMKAKKDEKNEERKEKMKAKKDEKNEERKEKMKAKKDKKKDKKTLTLEEKAKKEVDKAEKKAQNKK